MTQNVPVAAPSRHIINALAAAVGGAGAVVAGGVGLGPAIGVGAVAGLVIYLYEERSRASDRTRT
jgi:hypothetical protein